MKNQVSPIFYPFQIKGQGRRERAGRRLQRGLEGLSREEQLNQQGIPPAGVSLDHLLPFLLPTPPTSVAPKKQSGAMWPPISHEKSTTVARLKRGTSHPPRFCFPAPLRCSFPAFHSMPSSLCCHAPIHASLLLAHRWAQTTISCPKQAHLWPNLLPVSNTALFLFYSMTNPSISTLSTSS